jgi:hypothetical protein
MEMFWLNSAAVAVFGSGEWLNINAVHRSWQGSTYPDMPNV